MTKLNDIINLLEKQYNNPDFNNKSNTIDELIYIILAKRTNYKCNNVTYNALKKKYPDWLSLLWVSEEEIYKQIKHGGLGKEKSKYIINLLRIIHEDFGTLQIATYLQ